MKKLTKEQEARLAGLHSKASDILNECGFSRLRAFTAAGSTGGESFEIWAKNGRTVIVQFYAEAGGVELYGQHIGNSWGAFRAGLEDSIINA